MKEFEVVNMGNNNPYPMYFTLRGKDGESFQSQAKDDDGRLITRKEKPVMDNFANGVSTLTVVHTKPISVGDTIKIGTVKHTVEEITEQREPAVKTADNPYNVNHHPANAIWYNIKATYTRFLGQSVSA